MGRLKVWSALAAGGMLAAGLAAGPASAATSVAGGAVTASPSTAGAVSSYQIAFRTTSALASGGTITFQAPAGTGFVSCATNCQADYTIAVSGKTVDTATVGTAVASIAGAGTTDNQVVLTLATSTVAAGDTVTVTTQGTTNPTVASLSYTITESTSADTAAVSSSPYAISAGPVAKISVASGSNQSAQAGTAYASPLVAEVEDSYGNPVAGASVLFSSPASPSAGVTFNGCAGAASCTVTTDGGGAARSGVVTADSTTGSFPVTASVSTTGGNQAATFTLTNTAVPPSSVTPGTVGVSATQVGATGVNYTATFTTTTALATGGTVTLVFPNGTSLPPASCFLSCASYTVAYGGGTSAPVTGVTTKLVPGPGSSSNSPTPNEVILTLGGVLNPVNIPAHTPVGVAISGVANPTAASSSYVADESTSSDPGAVASSTYTITPGPAVGLYATAGSGQSAVVGSSFASPLVATAVDAYSNPVPGVQVVFAIGSSGGAGATFSNGTNTESDPTSATGRAITSPITADSTVGSYTVTAKLASGGTASASFTLTNSAYTPAQPGVPAAIATRSGSGQTATVGTPFGTPFGVYVTDAYGTPVDGAPVTFTAPTTGASGAFAGGGNSETDVTSAGSTATSQFTANTVEGTYTVIASTPNGVQAAFTVTNTAAAPVAVKMVSGQNQTAAVGTAFANPFVAEAVDSYGNPVPYVNMLFGGPTSGPGGTFSNGLTYESDTANAQGLATSSTFTANGTAGTYQLAAGLSTSNFTLFTETNGGSSVPGGSGGGYWLARPDGAVQAFGDAAFYGSAYGAPLARPVVAIAGAPDGTGYWLVASDGGVFDYGQGAKFHGSAGGLPLVQPIVGMAADPATGGYWLVAADGGVFSYDAPFYGSTGGIHLNKPIVGMAAAPGGNGYWLVASDGGIFAFGPGARFYGSTGAIHLNKPVVGMAAAPGGNGYWMVASDGGIFSFGPGAHFYGSTGNVALDYPVVGMAAAPGGNGYWLVAYDGGIFSFGPGAPFRGSAANQYLPVVGMAAS